MPPKFGRTEKVQDAPIQKLLSEVKQPKDTISLGQGIPFFGPPEEAIAAATAALSDELYFKYTEDAGLPSLRGAISKKLDLENKIKVDSDTNVMVTAGGNQAFINAIMAITNLDDDILILSPYYFNTIMAVKLAGCNPITVDTDENYQPNPSTIFSQVTPRTRAIVTISPNNPSGAVYDEDALKQINEFCAKKGIYHISDEAYEHFIFDDANHISALSFDSEITHTISLYSFSKSYGMSGYRVGYMVYPSELHNELLKVQDTIGICPPGPSQAAAEAALKVGSKYPRKFLPTISQVRHMFVDELKAIENIYMPDTKGSFYFLLRLHTNKSSWEIAKRLIEEFGLITIPGEVFGMGSPSLRVSYGNLQVPQAKEGITRLVTGLDEIME